MDAENSAQTASKAQYVVTEKSLKGIGGWLTYVLIALGGNSISGFLMFFTAMATLVDGAEGIAIALQAETMIFGLLIAAAALIATILIATRKKLGILMTFITLGITALYTTVQAITSMFELVRDPGCYDYSYFSYSWREPVCDMVSKSPKEIIMLVAVIFAAWLAAFLIGLYFKTSKRVKLTLTK